MVPNCATAEDLLKTIKDDKVQMIDLRFSDLPGVWQHFSVPPSAVNIDALEEGIGFDGSSIRGFQEIQESDMLVVPDPTTAFVDPFTPATTLVLICNIRDPVTGQSYSRDPRFIAQKAETYLKGTGRADTSYFGPEAEFFVFNDVRYGQGINYAFHEIDSSEGSWNTGKKEAPNLGHKPRAKEGYFPVPPTDSMQALRTEMVLTMESLGIQIEAHHHEVATGGQNEIDMRFTTLTRMADNLMIYKYVVKNTARQNGMTATFMPKPLFEDNASGMHVHQSLWTVNLTLQYDIDTIAAGNAFLPAFMEQYNARFAKAPFEDRDVHRALVIGHDDLDDAFAWKEERTVSAPDRVTFLNGPNRDFPKRRRHRRCNCRVSVPFHGKDKDLAGIYTIWISDPVSVRFVDDRVSRARAVGDTADAPQAVATGYDRGHNLGLYHGGR